MGGFSMVNNRGIGLLKFQEVIFLQNLLIRIEFLGLAVERDEKEVKLFGSSFFELDNMSQDNLALLKLPLWLELVD